MSWQKVMLGFVGLLVVLYTAVCVLAYLAQGGLIFFPPAPQPELHASLRQQTGAQALQLPDGHQGWHVPAAGERAVILFHGNASWVPGQVSLAAPTLVSAGWDVLAVEYPGYDGAPGSPSQDALVESALAAWRHATEVLGISGEHVVLHGQSLGGGVAAQLAARVKPGALVLESTFTSVRSIAASQVPWLPVGLLLRHPFDSLGQAEHIQCPVLVLHGDADGVIGVSHGRALGAGLVDATYVEVAGVGHNDGLAWTSPQATQALLAFLGRVSKASSPPEAPEDVAPLDP